MIDSYKFGEIVIDGKKFTHDVWIGMEEVSSWWREEGHLVSLSDIRGVLGEHPEAVVIGCGADSVMEVSQEVTDYFNDKKVRLSVKDSAAACEEYNRRKKEGKRIVALIHLTC